MILETKDCSNTELVYLEHSAGQNKRYEYCFIKQKWQNQIGMAHYKNAATPLSILGINTTHQHFQMRYATLF